MRRVNGVLAAAALLLAATQDGDAWERPHGDGANLNFENVATAPAGSLGVTKIPGLGSFALGAGPVIAADGTIYLGNQQGEVIALHADGSPYWRRKINVPQGVVTTPPIIASPVIGGDGTLYVVGAAFAEDHRAGKPPRIYESSLHRFTASGGYLGATMFPKQYKVDGYARAAPNIWRFQGKEMVLVPAIYGLSVRLIGFDPGGAVVADQLVTAFDPTIHGGNGLSLSENIVCVLTLGVGCIAGDFQRSNAIYFTPPPGVGIFNFAGGGTPFVLVSDHLHDVVGYSFSGGKFVELFRVHDQSLFMQSAPAILPDGHTIVGVTDADMDGYETPVPTDRGGAIFTGPNFNKVARIKGIGPGYAAPVRLADGRVLLSDGEYHLTVLQNNTVASKVDLYGKSLVSPVASQTHVFVSLPDAFVTLDTNGLAQVSQVNWTGGGVAQPAIGPKGHVYAIAGNTLYAFPPPRKKLPPNSVVPQTGATVVSTGTQDSKPYKPPMTTNGNRLFACEELDGDDCGKGDYNAIATAFCKKEGFVGAGQIEVDSKKVKAETLDGRFCSKNKCKVFEQIVCANN